MLFFFNQFIEYTMYCLGIVKWLVFRLFELINIHLSILIVTLILLIFCECFNMLNLFLFLLFRILNVDW